jgi:trehalose 6-phosphate phosphatase
MAPTPAEAVVIPEAREALSRLRDRLAFVGVVTGRAAPVGEALVDVPGLTYVGNHGLEWRRGGASVDHPSAVESIPAVRAALAEIQAGAEAAGLGDGVIIENKRLSGTVHYRLAEDPERAQTVLRRLAEAAVARHGLRQTEGRFIIELRPQAAVNKGTATADLIARHGLRAAVFFGDDTTDVDAFRTIRRLRERGELCGLRVGVVGPETPVAVREESDATVPSAEACVALMVAIADGLDRQ